MTEQTMMDAEELSAVPHDIERTKPKPKGRAEERIKDLVRRNRSLERENQVLARQLEEALALNEHLAERLRQRTGALRLTSCEHRNGKGM